MSTNFTADTSWWVEFCQQQWSISCSWKATPRVHKNGRLEEERATPNWSELLNCTKYSNMYLLQRLFLASARAFYSFQTVCLGFRYLRQGHLVFTIHLLDWFFSLWGAPQHLWWALSPPFIFWLHIDLQQLLEIVKMCNWTHVESCTSGYSWSQPRSQAFPIFVLRFAFSIIHGSGRAAKNGEGLRTLIMWHGHELDPLSHTGNLVYLAPTQYSKVFFCVNNRCHISSIRRHGYYLFHCLFCAATIWGQRLFLWKAWRHQLWLDKVGTSETMTVKQC